MLISTISVIIDGQNEDVIGNYTDTAYHPCLLRSLLLDKRVTVHFTSNIGLFRDWYPDICSTLEDDKDYINEYMFDGAQQWHFSNLKLTQSAYLLIRSQSYHADITCTECIFGIFAMNMI